MVMAVMVKEPGLSQMHGWEEGSSEQSQSISAPFQVSLRASLGVLNAVSDFDRRFCISNNL